MNTSETDSLREAQEWVRKQAGKAFKVGVYYHLDETDMADLVRVIHKEGWVHGFKAGGEHVLNSLPTHSVSERTT